MTSHDIYLGFPHYLMELPHTLKICDSRNFQHARTPNLAVKWRRTTTSYLTIFMFQKQDIGLIFIQVAGVAMAHVFICYCISRFFWALDSRMQKYVNESMVNVFG